jgi:protocadherin delta 2
MTAIAVKSKHQDKEAGNYKCRMAEYSNSNPPVGKGKKKRINKNEILLVQSEMEERDSVSRMNVVSSPSLITSPICFDYQTTSPLPLTLPRSEVMYLKTTSNSLTVPRAGCHSSFAGLTTETPMNRMSVIQVRNRVIVPCWYFIQICHKRGHSSNQYSCNQTSLLSFVFPVWRHMVQIEGPKMQHDTPQAH